MDKPKYTKLEIRAREACDHFNLYKKGTFVVKWANSQAWGKCPLIKWNGLKAAYAGGCGYDKLSAVLTEFLQFLPEVDLRGCSGGGLSVVKEKLLAAGWALERVYEDNDLDVFNLRQVERVPETRVVRF